MWKHLVIVIAVIFIISCACKGNKFLGPGKGAKHEWTKVDPALWSGLLPGAKSDAEIAIPSTDLAAENIGTKTRIRDTFDRWTLLPEKRDRLFYNWADVTSECKGLIETEYAMTPEEWSVKENQIRYFESIDKLIEEVVSKLLADMNAPFEAEERELFIRALKSVKWNESLWQHYYRYKDWFFVLLSDNPFNEMSNWGISQIARSDYLSKVLLNRGFFESKGYCSISSSLYYGSLIYYSYYMDARSKECNGNSTVNRLVGAYNSYASGYSSCFFDVERKDEAMQRFQIGAHGGFLTTFLLKRWEMKMNSLKGEISGKAGTIVK